MNIFETQLNVRSDQQITGKDSETWSDRLLKSSKKYFDIESKTSLAIIFGLALGALALIGVLMTMPVLTI